MNIELKGPNLALYLLLEELDIEVNIFIRVILNMILILLIKRHVFLNEDGPYRTSLSLSFNFKSSQILL